MTQTTDIREQAHLSGEAVKGLNFISNSNRYLFRKYYRSGLRSHIFEVLSARDAENETTGILVDGIRIFPRAEPVKMFRILRQRFENCDAAFREIKKYKLLLQWLGQERIAASEEFIVDYTDAGSSQIVLCGLQEYVRGDILDPWRLFDTACLKQIFLSRGYDPQKSDHCLSALKKNIAAFVAQVRKMIACTGYIPDLAGNGNLIATPQGGLKLVDINNIVRIRLDDTILIDDKGYPSCDVSVEVLSILEQMVSPPAAVMDDPLYRLFLDPVRKTSVKALERAFYKKYTPR